MKRPRPHIPMSVRRIVARRQLVELTEARGIPGAKTVHLSTDDLPIGDQLAAMLKWLFDGNRCALDHNPALILRDFNPRTGKYKPDANDPDHLIYRSVEDHIIKTHRRGDGAQRSDTSERMHRRRMEENRGLRPRKPKAKIAGRSSWPTGRKLKSRGFRC